MKKIVIIFLLLLPVIVLAADPHTEEMDNLQKLFFEQSNSWGEGLIEKVVYPLFFSLAIISITWTCIRMAIQGSDLPDIVKEFIIFILLTGFWFYVIDNANYFSQAVLDSFTQAANVATGLKVEVSPTGILNEGLNLAAKILKGVKWYDFGYMIIALIIVFIYCYIAITVLMCLLEAYIITGGGIIVLGFAGSPWTSDIAKKYFLFALSVGIKLFVTYLIIGAGINIINGYKDANLTENRNVLTLIGITFGFLFLVSRVPTMAQGITSGASIGATPSMSSMAASIAKAGASVAAAIAGAGAAIHQAHNAAKEAVGGGGGESPTLAAAQIGGGLAGAAAPAVASGESGTSGGQESSGGGSEGATSESASGASSASGGRAAAAAGNATVQNAKSSRLKNGLAYLKAFSAAYAKGDLGSTWDRWSDPAKKNTTVAQKIRENTLKEKIEKAGKE